LFANGKVVARDWLLLFHHPISSTYPPFWIDLPPLGAFRYCWAALAALAALGLLGLLALLGLLGGGSWGAQAPLDLGGQRSGDFTVMEWRFMGSLGD
jgi:hypothetical protein